MLERLHFGDLPAKPHTTLRGQSGLLRYEECITRAGFDGPYTIVYHSHRPHEAEPIETAPASGALTATIGDISVQP